MCSKFQRTSSSVEGRNGYLSARPYANRGFTQQILTVLTIPSSIILTFNVTMALRLLNASLANPFPICLLQLFKLWASCPDPDAHENPGSPKPLPYLLSRLKLLPVLPMSN